MELQEATPAPKCRTKISTRQNLDSHELVAAQLISKVLSPRTFSVHPMLTDLVNAERGDGEHKLRVFGLLVLVAVVQAAPQPRVAVGLPLPA